MTRIPILRTPRIPQRSVKSFCTSIPRLSPPASTSTNPLTSQTLTRSSQFLLPVFARPDIVLSHGQGSYVWDTEGRRYLDFSAGIAVNALGHADQGVTKVPIYPGTSAHRLSDNSEESTLCSILSEQAGSLLHTSNVYHHEWAGKLAELLVTLTQREGGMGYSTGTAPSTTAKVFFSNSGAEANEGALKIARKVGKDRWAAAKPGRAPGDAGCTKTRIVCFENAFHGRTMGALSVTPNPKYQAPFGPLVPGVDVGKLNDVNGLEKLVTEDTCAVIVEPIQGEGGIHEAREKWLRLLRKRCDEVGAVLIFDEIQCGLFRTGRLWAHSALPVDCHPDIVTMAKPLGNGYPIGAVLLRDAVAGTMTAGTHGTTFGGSPLACAIGHHVLSRLASEESKAQVAETSGYLHARLSELPSKFPCTLEQVVRGRGLILGLGFQDTHAPGKVVQLARERGLFVLTAGKDAVRLVPSLTAGKAEVDLAVELLVDSLKYV